MKVILIKTVPNLGQTGDIKEVAEGYARNFLIPRNLVKIATEQTIKELEGLKVRKLKTVENKGKKYKEIAKKVDNLKLIIKAKASASASDEASASAKATADGSADKGKEKKTLFAAIKAENIAQELKKRNYDIEAKFIKLEQPIKQLGYQDVLLDFGSGVTAKIGLTIVREE